MAFAAEIRKTVTDTTPVYAAVGLTDLAVEKVRDARERTTAARTELSTQLSTQLTAEKLTALASTSAKTAVEQAQQVPAKALNRGLEVAGKAQESYEAFAVRGEKLVKRVRDQKSTKDLLAQAESTLAIGKGAVTTVKKSALDIQRSAKATLTTGRKEAVAAADAIADSVVEEAAEATATVKKSATATRTAAKRTATTTRKSATATKTAAKRTSTATKKTAARTTKAAAATAEKVGD